MYRHAWLQALSVNYRIVQKLCSLLNAVMNCTCSYFMHLTAELRVKSVCVHFIFLAGRLCVVRIPLGVFWLQHICLSLQPISGTGSCWCLCWWSDQSWGNLIIQRSCLCQCDFCTSIVYTIMCTCGDTSCSPCPTVASSEVFLAPTPHSNSYCIFSKHSSFWIWNTLLNLCFIVEV